MKINYGCSVLAHIYAKHTPIKGRDRILKCGLYDISHKNWHIKEGLEKSSFLYTRHGSEAKQIIKEIIKTKSLKNVDIRQSKLNKYHITGFKIGLYLGR